MKVVAATVGPLPATIIKMEDRKRAAGQSVDDLAPPTKRQAMNGGSKVSVDADMPWKDDLEVSSSIFPLHTIPLLPWSTTRAKCHCAIEVARLDDTHMSMA
jgi:E3 ubiquitin-protein ligase BRE1